MRSTLDELTDLDGGDGVPDTWHLRLSPDLSRELLADTPLDELRGVDLTAMGPDPWERKAHRLQQAAARKPGTSRQARHDRKVFTE